MSRRAEVLAEWYRKQVYAALPPIIEKWERQLGVRVERVFVQKMRTKWGSANPVRKSIRLNTELAKKHPKFLEYVVLHEMAHFLAPKHDERFKQLLTRHLPAWHRIRDELNASSVPEAS